MPITAIPGQYPDNISAYGHVPGVRGGAIGTFAKITSKLTYRGAKWLGSRFFKPKKYTYAGATGRGIAVGTAIVGLLPTPEIDDLDGTIPGTPNFESPYRFQQGNRRRRGTDSSRRCTDRHRHRNCC